MKYFGKKSLSSFLNRFMNVSWFVVLIGAIIGTVIGALFITALTLGKDLVSENPQSTSSPSTQILQSCVKKMEPHKKERLEAGLRYVFEKCRGEIKGKERKDFETFVNLPFFVKMLLFPYFWAVVVLLLLIIKKSRVLFSNFEKDIVFNRNNVQLLSTISKISIAISILTFSISSLCTSVFLLMICELVKNGTALQEEHDLTV